MNKISPVIRGGKETGKKSGQGAVFGSDENFARDDVNVAPQCSRCYGQNGDGLLFSEDLGPARVFFHLGKDPLKLPQRDAEDFCRLVAITPRT